ncbi:MAG: alpha/beta hydrolase [Oscillospiraceae bacterium]|jgi:pimeloyl-ACP methyl ester carboxylesterase|nr:Alpha/beta hydrolase [Ruminococcaceae bacterium BL-4]
MIFKEVGRKKFPTIILLHGGGLSDWSWNPTIQLLSSEFHLVTPILDGHGEDGSETFISIQKCAEELISYIENDCDGKVFAIGGLSVGAQITVEILSTKPDIAQYAIIESALTIPIKGTTAITVPAYQFLYGLIKKRWFSKLQAKSLCVPDELFETYYQDSQKISKQSLINLTLSNGNYYLKPSIAATHAKVLIIVGSDEIKVMKESAELLHRTIPKSQLYIAKNMKHGQLSLVHTEQYIKLLKNFFKIKE